MPQLPTSPTLDLWREITVATGTALAVLGFFRSLEQKKDEAYNDMTVRLCNKESPVMRAAAAHQMPSFHRYRRYLVLHRPYARQTLELAANALKMRQAGHGADEAADEPETLFVVQALADSLMTMLRDIDRRERRWPGRPLRRGSARLLRLLPAPLAARWPFSPWRRWAERPGRRAALRLIQARLDSTILMGFCFDRVDLTEASLVHCGLEGASFVGANLWKAHLRGSNLEGADLTGARLWDADFGATNLCRAILATDMVNDQTQLTGANVRGAVLSPEVARRCRHQGCNVGEATVR